MAVAWAELNHLTLNPKMTKAIVFRIAQLIKLFKELQITQISTTNTGDQMKFVDEIVRLDIILDNSVTKKVNKSLYGLRFIKACTSQSLRKRLVESLVLHHLDYCTVVYPLSSKTPSTA